jgi:hypothetical protein
MFRVWIRQFLEPRIQDVHSGPDPQRISDLRGKDSAMWYSTHTCSTLLRFNYEHSVFI